MKVSIVVPVYNVERGLLEPCLNSIVKQTVRREEYEIILVDDFSTHDDTIAIIREFTSRTDNTKLVRHAENLGPNEARRSGVKAARGDYVLFIDGDDMLPRDAVESLSVTALRTGADLVTAPALRWLSRTKSYSPFPYRVDPLPSEYVARLMAAFAEQSFTMWGRLIKRSILSDAVFDLPPRLVHEDLATFARILFRSRTVANSQTPAYYYTMNEAGLTYRFVADHVYGMFYAFDDWIEHATSFGLLEDLSAAISHGIERLVHILVIRCIMCETLDGDDKLSMLNSIGEKYRALGRHCREPALPGTQLLGQIHTRSAVPMPERLTQAVNHSFPGGVPVQPDIETRLENTLVPTEVARRLKDRIVFVCEGDRQLRAAGAFARGLGPYGHPCAILDNSAFAPASIRQSVTRRKRTPADMEHIRVTRPPYDPDWLSTARLVITFNGSNDGFRDALEYRHLLGLPSACMIELPEDSLGLDSQDCPRLSCHRCDYIFLAESGDGRHFEDGHTCVVGFPAVDSPITGALALSKKPPAALKADSRDSAPGMQNTETVARVENAFADAVSQIVERHRGQQALVADLFFERLQEQEPFESHNPGTILGDFEQHHRARLPEEDLIARYLGDTPGIMVNIGARKDDRPDLFRARGWQVHTVEPDVVVGQPEGFTLGQQYQAGAPAHVRLLWIGGSEASRFIMTDYLPEGHRPEVILVELQDASGACTGYSSHDVAEALLRRQYTVYVSEWLPAVRSSHAHAWRRLVGYSQALELDTAQCNMIGFSADPGRERLGSLARRTLKFSGARGADRVSPRTANRPSLLARWYRRALYRFGPYVMRRHPRLAALYRKLRDRGLLPQPRL